MRLRSGVAHYAGRMKRKVSDLMARFDVHGSAYRELESQLGEERERNSRLGRELESLSGEVSSLNVEVSNLSGEVERLEKVGKYQKGNIEFRKRQLAGLRDAFERKSAEDYVAMYPKEFALVVDHKDNVRAVTRVAARRLGYDAAEIVGKNIYTFVPETVQLRYKMHTSVSAESHDPVLLKGVEVKRAKGGSKKMDLMVGFSFGNNDLNSESRIYTGCVVREVTSAERKEMKLATKTAERQARRRSAEVLSAVSTDMAERARRIGKA